MAGQSLNDFPKQILQECYEIQQQLGKKAGRRTLLAHDIQTEQLVIIKLLTIIHELIALIYKSIRLD